MDCLDFLAVQGTLKSLLQYHSSKAPILQCSAFLIVQLSHAGKDSYMTTGKTIALTRWTSVCKVMSLLLNMLSRLVIIFLPRSKCLLISWLRSLPSMILEPPKIKSDIVSTVSPSISHDHIDSTLKSRNITLPTKVHLVKAMVFLVVMYGCESWTIKKVEHQRIDAFELWFGEDS